MPQANTTTPLIKTSVLALNFIRRLHFYIGLFIAPFIVVAALSGTLYVLTPQIENLLYAKTLKVDIPINPIKVNDKAIAQTLSQQIEAARLYIGQEHKIYAVRPAPKADDTTRVQFVDSRLGESESRAIFVNPYTLAITGDFTVYGTSGVLPFRTWLDQFHRSLLLGDVGRNYSELAASWLWLVALGGLALYCFSRSNNPKIARTRKQHKTLGLILLIGLLFLSITGLTWSQWAGDNITQLRSQLNWLTPQVNSSLKPISHTMANDEHADHKNMAMNGMDMSRPKNLVNYDNSDWDKVLTAARNGNITADKIEIRQPKAQDKAWIVSEIDRSWPTHVDAIAIEPNNFSVLDTVRFNNFPLVAKLTRWGIDMHMGILFGLINQIIIAAIGLGIILMTILGYNMWWSKRPKAASFNPVKTLAYAYLQLPFSVKALTLLIAIALGLALPLMGISLGLFIIIDLIRWRLHR